MKTTDFAGFIPRKNQLKAVYELSVKHRVINMATGEGKSLVAAMAAARIAESGRRVYVVTVNDYLARRDFELFHKQLISLNLSPTLNALDGDKSAIHQQQIIYTSVQNLLFDYVTNEFTPNGLRLDLDFAILDEIDYVLLDSANTRFSVNLGDGCGRQDFLALDAVWQFALALPNSFYTWNLHKKEVNLSDAAYDKLEAAFALMPDDERYRDIVSYLHTALLALHCYREGVEYLVEPDGVLSVLNPHNGRACRNSHFNNELDFFLRMKENIRFPSMIGSYTNTMSAPILFRKFRTVVGLSGTAAQARHELGVLLGSDTKDIRSVTRSKRAVRHKRFRTHAEKRAYISDFIRRHCMQYAYLVVCEHEKEAREVFAHLSDTISNELTLLTNLQCSDEQHILDNAALRGRVLVSTHLVGRGTDIVSECLAVLVTHRGADVRVFLQVLGRTGRNGHSGIALLLTCDEDAPQYHHFETQRAMSLCEDIIFENAKEEILQWVNTLAENAADSGFEALLRQEFMYSWLDFRRSLEGRLLYDIAGNSTEFVYAACTRMKEELKILKNDILERLAYLVLRS